MCRCEHLFIIRQCLAAVSAPEQDVGQPTSGVKLIGILTQNFLVDLPGLIELLLPRQDAGQRRTDLQVEGMSCQNVAVERDRLVIHSLP